MSDWNYTECSRPFPSEEAARTYMREKDFAGWILKRENGYTAVCPTYPAGYYPDAEVVAEIHNSKRELSNTPKGLPLTSCC